MRVKEGFRPGRCNGRRIRWFGSGSIETINHYGAENGIDQTKIFNGGTSCCDRDHHNSCDVTPARAAESSNDGANRQLCFESSADRRRFDRILRGPQRLDAGGNLIRRQRRQPDPLPPPVPGISGNCRMEGVADGL